MRVLTSTGGHQDLIANYTGNGAASITPDVLMVRGNMTNSAAPIEITGTGR
jgi:hypothetical protein